MQIDVILADGRRIRHTLSKEQNTFGRSEDADISIPEASELEPLHLMLIPRSDGCWISTAKDSTIVASIAGKTFDNGLVRLGSEIDIGSITLALIKSEGAEVSKAGRVRKIVMLTLIALVLAFAFFGVPSARDQALKETDETAPLLFDEEGFKCPASGAQMRGVGAKLAENADSKMTRYHYDAQDGIEAVFLLDQAYACFRGSNDANGAAQVKAVRDSFKSKLNDEYAQLRLELSRDLKNKRYKPAHESAIKLKNLTAHRSGGYIEWLDKIYRQLTVRVEKSKKT